LADLSSFSRMLQIDHRQYFKGRQSIAFRLP
jgi:hypothetical protein